MNEELKTKIRDLIQAWVAEDSPAILDGFVLVASWSDAEGSSRWSAIPDIDLPVSQTVGLLEMAKLHVLALSDTGLPIRYQDEED